MSAGTCHSRAVRALAPLLLLASGALAPAARAEPRGDLAAAEDAYRAVDFEAVLRLAEAAKRSGGLAPDSMARLESLLGVANAALGRPQPAQAAFIRMLGIDPELRLERELSPRLRAPYLEARGFWSSRRERLSASARIESGALLVSLSDPAAMVRSLRVSMRFAGQADFVQARLPAAADVRVGLGSEARARSLDVALALLDEFDNVLGERGTQRDPVHVEAEAVRVVRPPRRSGGGVDSEGRSYWLPSTFAVLGAASAATGAYFHVQRERAAGDWNGPGCEQPGPTRGEQCAAVERRVERDAWLAVGFYAGGAALLTLGVVGFLANSGATRERTSTSVACDAILSSTLGVRCAGSF
jgi:hypothetical protein